MSFRERIMAAEGALEIGVEPGITADITRQYAKLLTMMSVFVDNDECIFTKVIFSHGTNCPLFMAFFFSSSLSIKIRFGVREKMWGTPPAPRGLIFYGLFRKNRKVLRIA
jgi:hypothetical protein